MWEYLNKDGNANNNEDKFWNYTYYYFEAGENGCVSKSFVKIRINLPLLCRENKRGNNVSNIQCFDVYYLIYGNL